MKDGGVGDVGQLGEVPHNVVECVARRPHLHQVASLLGGQVRPLPAHGGDRGSAMSGGLKAAYSMSSGSCAWLEVTVGRPRVRLRDLTTSLETPPVVRSSTSEGGVPESSIESRAAHTGGSVMQGWLL